MPSIPAAVHVIAWAVLGTAASVAIVGQRDVNRRLDAVEEAKTGAGAGAPSAIEAAEKEKEIKALQAQLNASEARQTNLTAEVRKDVQKVWAELMKTPEGGAAAANPAAANPAAFEEAVRGVIDRYAVDHKFREAVQKAAGPLVPKKPSFLQLATALKLRPEQAERLQGEVRAIQQELFEVLQIPRSDGIAPLEEIQMAEQYPEGNPKRNEGFMKLVKLTIPDTQETYFERAAALVAKVKAGTKTYFDADQTSTLDTIDLDWFGIRMQ